MPFSQNLRNYREKTGYTAKEFASKLGIKYSTYAAYENQGSEPKYELLCKIAEKLNVTIDDLLGYRLSELNYWIAKWKNLFPSIHIEIDGEQIKIQQDKFPYVPPAVFPTIDDFITNNRICEFDAKKEHDSILKEKLYHMLFYKILENYDEAEKHHLERHSQRGEQVPNHK